MNDYIEELYDFLKKEIRRFRTRKFNSKFSSFPISKRAEIALFCLKILWAYPVVTKVLYKKYRRKVTFDISLMASFMMFLDDSKLKENLKIKLSVKEGKIFNRINIEKLKLEINKNAWNRNFHPKWLYEFYVSVYGKSGALKIMKFNNEISNQYFIIEKADRKDEILLELTEQIGEKPKHIHNNLFSIPFSPMIFDFNHFEPMKNGEIFHSSIPAILMGEMVEFIHTGVDLCAAPGGKSVALKAKFRDMKLISLDFSFNKCKKMEEKFSSNEFLSDISVINHNAFNTPFKKESFDLVMLDSPCSGSGIMRNRPELRWRMKPTDLSKNINLQKELIKNASTLVKENGFLIYSTCSINPAENIDIIEDFLKENKEFIRHDKKVKIDSENVNEFSAIQTIAPHLHNLDGFFYGVIRKECLK
jgi:16S rRNA (cytosine967-C5)-methyltransferase